jgi:hypothetical protein
MTACRGVVTAGTRLRSQMLRGHFSASPILELAQVPPLGPKEGVSPLEWRAVDRLLTLHSLGSSLSGPGSCDEPAFKAGPYYPRDPLHSTSGESPFAYTSDPPCATASGIHATDTRIRGLCNGDRSNARSRPAQQHEKGPQRYRQHAAQQRPGRR